MSDGIRLFPEIGQPTWVELIVVSGTGHIHRELDDPAVYPDALAVAQAHGCRPESHVPYVRARGVLERIPWDTPVSTRLSLVVVEGTPPGGLPRLESLLRTLPGILPARMT